MHRNNKTTPIMTSQSHLEEYYANWIKKLLDVRKIHYDPQDLKILPGTIGFGGSASVYAAKWKDTSTIYAIKKFVENKEVLYVTDSNSLYRNKILKFIFFLGLFNGYG